MTNFSILINSCDAYRDAWNPFFRILEKTWPQAKNRTIYLNTESLDYKDSFFDVKVINSGKNTPWGQRLLKVVEKIDSDYVLMLLEDFFFEKEIEEDSIEKCVNYLDNNERIACFSFTTANESTDLGYCNKHIDERYPSFVKRKQFGDYKYNASPSLWRKSALQKWTFRNDTPWHWEFFGNKRTWFSKDEFYSLRVDANPVFVYDVEHGGAIHRGKWVGYKMRELQEKYNIKIDLSQREVEEDWMIQSQTPVKPFYMRLNSVFRNRIKYVESVIIAFFYR